LFLVRSAALRAAPDGLRSLGWRIWIGPSIAGAGATTVSLVTGNPVPIIGCAVGITGIFVILFIGHFVWLLPARSRWWITEIYPMTWTNEAAPRPVTRVDIRLRNPYGGPPFQIHETKCTVKPPVGPPATSTPTGQGYWFQTFYPEAYPDAEPLANGKYRFEWFARTRGGRWRRLVPVIVPIVIPPAPQTPKVST